MRWAARRRLERVDLAFEVRDLGVDELEGFLQVAGVEVCALAEPVALDLLALAVEVGDARFVATLLSW